MISLAKNRVRGDDARHLRQDPPAEFLASHGESTALSVGQAQRTIAQLLAQNAILLPEIVDQVFVVTVESAGDSEHEELKRMRHPERLTAVGSTYARL